MLNRFLYPIILRNFTNSGVVCTVVYTAVTCTHHRLNNILGLWHTHKVESCGGEIEAGAGSEIFDLN